MSKLSSINFRCSVCRIILFLASTVREKSLLPVGIQTCLGLEPSRLREQDLDNDRNLRSSSLASACRSSNDLDLDLWRAQPSSRRLDLEREWRGVATWLWAYSLRSSVKKPFFSNFAFSASSRDISWCCGFSASINKGTNKEKDFTTYFLCFLSKTHKKLKDFDSLETVGNFTPLTV